MLRRRKSPPSYRLHRPTGQAVVTLNGRDHYLGKHGARESKDAYDRLIAEWLASGRNLPTPAPAPKTTIRREEVAPRAAEPAGPPIKQILLAYLDHAASYYRGPDGRSTAELDNMVAVARGHD